MKVYVVSSWRNQYFDSVFTHIVGRFPHAYNFKASGGFHWSQVLGPDWVKTPLDEYTEGLKHPDAEKGFLRDDVALRSAKATVLVLPAGSSAHLELGVAVGLAQFTAIYAPEPIEPELMYYWANVITDDLDQLLEELEEYQTSIWSSVK